MPIRAKIETIARNAFTIGIVRVRFGECTMVFFWARVAHPIAMVGNLWGTRTLAFAVGWIAVLVHLFTVLAASA
jgi:hypothetical protein